METTTDFSIDIDLTAESVSLSSSCGNLEDDLHEMLNRSKEYYEDYDGNVEHDLFSVEIGSQDMSIEDDDPPLFHIQDVRGGIQEEFDAAECTTTDWHSDDNSELSAIMSDHNYSSRDYKQLMQTSNNNNNIETENAMTDATSLAAVDAANKVSNVCKLEIKEESITPDEYGNDATQSIFLEGVMKTLDAADDDEAAAQCNNTINAYGSNKLDIEDEDKLTTATEIDNVENVKALDITNNNSITDVDAASLPDNCSEPMEHNLSDTQLPELFDIGITSNTDSEDEFQKLHVFTVNFHEKSLELQKMPSAETKRRFYIEQFNIFQNLLAQHMQNCDNEQKPKTIKKDSCNNSNSSDTDESCSDTDTNSDDSSSSDSCNSSKRMSGIVKNWSSSHISANATVPVDEYDTGVNFSAYVQQEISEDKQRFLEAEYSVDSVELLTTECKMSAVPKQLTEEEKCDKEIKRLINLNTLATRKHKIVMERKKKCMAKKKINQKSEFEIFMKDTQQQEFEDDNGTSISDDMELKTEDQLLDHLNNTIAQRYTKTSSSDDDDADSVMEVARATNEDNSLHSGESDDNAFVNDFLKTYDENDDESNAAIDSDAAASDSASSHAGKTSSTLTAVSKTKGNGNRSTSIDSEIEFAQDEAEYEERCKKRQLNEDKRKPLHSLISAVNKRQQTNKIVEEAICVSSETDASASDAEEVEQEQAEGGNRRSIKPMLRKDQLANETLRAQQKENERIKRLDTQQKKLSKLLKEHSDVGEASDLVLDYIEKTKTFIKVHSQLSALLKDHQRDGVKFMYDSCYGGIEAQKKHNGSGCILAHCMGLGKTLQLITLMHTLASYKELNTTKILVLCPKSTVMNWDDEIHHWLGKLRNLRVFTLRDPSTINDKLNTIREWSMSTTVRAGCLLLGYEAFRSLVFQHKYKNKSSMSQSRLDDIRKKIEKFLLNPGADLVVCDEGHIIKNSKSAISLAVSQIKSSRRIVLTGTPIQNNLKEYYSMVNFVKPNFLGTEKEFANLYANPIREGHYKDSNSKLIKVMKQRSFVLNKKLSRFVQRKEPELLKSFLPQKFEYVVFVPMTEVQNKLYEYILNVISRRGERGKSLITDYTCLRKIWTHPKVLEDAWKNAKLLKLRKEKERSKQINSDDEPDDIYDSQTGDMSVTNDWWRHLLTDHNLESVVSSNKLRVMFDILRMCSEKEEKCLIFSAFVAVLNVVEYFFKKITEGDADTIEILKQSQVNAEQRQWINGQDYYRLDGKTPKNLRHDMIKEFNSEANKRARVFLISAKAGGQGINLIGANRVIILDTSWNPSNDQQNIFRIFRLGQKRNCYVYRLLAMGTMEEKVYSRSVTKQAMSYRVVDEQQIDRHYSMAELKELYDLNVPNFAERPVPKFPKDHILVNLLTNYADIVYKYLEHDSLLENKVEQELSEQEKQDAWDAYERELKMSNEMQHQPTFMGDPNMFSSHNYDFKNFYFPFNGQTGPSNASVNMPPMHFNSFFPPLRNNYDNLMKGWADISSPYAGLFFNKSHNNTPAGMYPPPPPPQSSSAAAAATSQIPGMSAQSLTSPAANLHANSSATNFFNGFSDFGMYGTNGVAANASSRVIPSNSPAQLPSPHGIMSPHNFMSPNSSNAMSTFNTSYAYYNELAKLMQSNQKTKSPPNNASNLLLNNNLTNYASMPFGAASTANRTHAANMAATTAAADLSFMNNAMMAAARAGSNLTNSTSKRTTAAEQQQQQQQYRSQPTATQPPTMAHAQQSSEKRNDSASNNSITALAALPNITATQMPTTSLLKPKQVSNMQKESLRINTTPSPTVSDAGTWSTAPPLSPATITPIAMTGSKSLPTANANSSMHIINLTDSPTEQQQNKSQRITTAAAAANNNNNSNSNSKVRAAAAVALRANNEMQIIPTSSPPGTTSTSKHFSDISPSISLTALRPTATTNAVRNATTLSTMAGMTQSTNSLSNSAVNIQRNAVARGTQQLLQQNKLPATATATPTSGKLTAAAATGGNSKKPVAVKFISNSIGNQNSNNNSNSSSISSNLDLKKTAVSKTNSKQISTAISAPNMNNKLQQRMPKSVKKLPLAAAPTATSSNSFTPTITATATNASQKSNVKKAISKSAVNSIAAQRTTATNSNSNSNININSNSNSNSHSNSVNASGVYTAPLPVVAGSGMSATSINSADYAANRSLSAQIKSMANLATTTTATSSASAVFNRSNSNVSIKSRNTQQQEQQQRAATVSGITAMNKSLQQQQIAAILKSLPKQQQQQQQQRANTLDNKITTPLSKAELSARKAVDKTVLAGLKAANPNLSIEVRNKTAPSATIAASSNETATTDKFRSSLSSSLPKMMPIKRSYEKSFPEKQTGGDGNIEKKRFNDGLTVNMPYIIKNKNILNSNSLLKK